MKRLLLITVLPFAHGAPCITVDGDRIVAADLAARVPAFSRIEPSTVVGFTPFPGVARTFSTRELAAIAKRHGVEVAGLIPEVCVLRAAAALTPERIRSAMVSTLNDPRVHVEVLDFTRAPAPSGDLLFPPANLVPPPVARPEAPSLWRGFIRFSAGRSFAVWARVRIYKEAAVVVAARNIRGGTELTSTDLSLSERRLFPFAHVLESTQGVIGQAARCNIAAGTILSPALLAAPLDIRSGETVRVVSSEGLAQITFEAVALSAGRAGDRIMFRNPQSRLSFPAVVEGKGQARTAGTHRKTV